MCRFVLYLGESIPISRLTTEPNHSIVKQSYKAREREEPLNGDGFGVGWFAPAAPDEPAVFRSITPAWNNANLRDLARVTSSHCIMAHVRAATPPLPVVETNCHPFTAGPIVLMHNGYIPGFGDVRRALLRDLSDRAFRIIKGSTDSEHILAMVVDALAHEQQAAPDADPTIQLAAAVRATLTKIDALVKAHGIDHAPHLNVAVSDGKRAVVSRHCWAPEEADSLYVHAGKAYVCEDGVCRMVEPSDRRGSAVIIGSEPLSEDPGWDPVPLNHIAIVDTDRTVRFEPTL